MWVWGRKSLLTYISCVGWRLNSLLPCASALCFENAPRTLSPKGLHTVVTNLHSLDFCWRRIQSSTEIFCIFLLSFGACTIHHQMNHRIPGRIFRFILYSIQKTRNRVWSEGREKNLIHRSLRFSPYSSNEESINGFINAFQKAIVPFCTNPHPNQDTQLIQGSKHLRLYKCILGSFYVALKYKLLFLVHFENVLLAGPQILSELWGADEDRGTIACKLSVAKGKE